MSAKTLAFVRAKALYLQQALDTQDAARYLRMNGVCLELALIILTTKR